jgi:xylan 1,4-beta-xylosidase
MGSPQHPTAEQVAVLEKSGQLQAAGKPRAIKTHNGEAAITIALARQAVVLLKIKW